MGDFRRSRRGAYLGSGLFVCLILMIVFAQAVTAQSNGQPWSEPLNLSHSGATTQPQITVTPDGRILVAWIDQYDGFVVTQSQADIWTYPVSLKQIFKKQPTDMRLDSGSDGWVHLTWTDEDGSLYHRQVRGEDFTFAMRWSPSQLLAKSVAGFDQAIALDGRIHITFTNNETTKELTAGIYNARQTLTGAFTLPRLLYASPYFRGLEAEQSQVSVAVGGDGIVYAAWDEYNQDRVSLAISKDGGDTWSQPKVVDSRQEGDGGAQGPYRPTLSALGKQAMLVWQAGHKGTSCAQYFQSSINSGQSWSKTASLPGSLGQSCADNLQILQNPAAGTWLLASAASNVQITAWQPDTGGWSDPQTQNALSSFTDPETFRQIAMDCQYGALFGSKLLVVGCEREQNGDIWLLERILDNPKTLYPTPTPTPLWSTPAALDSGPEAFTSLTLASEATGRLHAFWSRPDDEAVYYALWDGTRWTQAQAVVNSPASTPQDLTVALDPGGQIFLAWSDSLAGGLFFSTAPISQAISRAKWTATQQIPTPGILPASPQAIILPGGKALLAYAAPFNEGRGIYTVQSQSALTSGQRIDWSTPEKVFDAEAAGWGSLSSPRLAQDATGGLHLLWIKNSLPPDSRAEGLYYAQKKAGEGKLWSQPVETVRGQVLWNAILTADGGTLHNAWQVLLGGKAVLFHQTSEDEGQSWSEATRLSGVQDTSGLPALVADASGQPNLLLISPAQMRATEDEPSLRRWTWQEGGWVEDDSQPLPGIQSPGKLAAAAAPGPDLGALFSGEQAPKSTAEPGIITTLQATTEPKQGLFFSGRKLESTSSAEQATPQETPTASNETQAPTSQITATPTIPAPTPTFSSQPAGGPLARLGGQNSILLIGGIPALVLSILLFFIGYRRMRR